MMDVILLVSRAALDGCEVYMSGMTLRVRGTQDAVARWKPEVRRCKAELLFLLRCDAQADLDLGQEHAAARPTTVAEIIALAQRVNAVFPRADAAEREAVLLASLAEPAAARASLDAIARVMTASKAARPAGDGRDHVHG